MSLPTPTPPPRTMTSTLIAVVCGVVFGILGLAVLAVLLAGRSGGEWIGLIVLGVVILGVVEGNNWRKKHLRR